MACWTSAGLRSQGVEHRIRSRRSDANPAPLRRIEESSDVTPHCRTKSRSAAQLAAHEFRQAIRTLAAAAAPHGLGEPLVRGPCRSISPHGRITPKSGCPGGVTVIGRSLTALLVALLLATGVAASEPLFEDLSDTLPVRHVYSGGWEHFVGGGVAVLDCNEDGYSDLYLAGGVSPTHLLINDTAEAGAPIRFRRADEGVPAFPGVIGAYPLDIDGDGHLDLFILRAGPNVVLRGAGGCRFSDATDAWGVPPGTAWTTAFSATWEAGQTWPTLAVGNYVDRSDPDGPFGTCDTHQLLRPDGHGYGQAEEIAPGYCALSMLFFDWSGTGTRDLWISNDRHYYLRDGHEQLFRISPGLDAYGEEDGWHDFKLWGMGIAARDLDGDARAEVAVTSMADQYLFERAGDTTGPSYHQTAYDRGTTAHIPYLGEDGRPSTGWHAAFGDVNNDGRDDLFIAKGNVEQMPSHAMFDPDNLLIQKPDGTFSEAGGKAGVSSLEKGRGAALEDFNRDGLLDLVVVQRGAPVRLYQNVTPTNAHWLKLRVSQTAGNVNAVGAQIEVITPDRRQIRQVLVGGGHAGGSASHEHFGLGDAEQVRVRVRWPDGVWSSPVELASDGHVLLRRTVQGPPDIIPD